jgi:hypothetical protein
MATQVYEAAVVQADELPNIESPVSGISWGAIVGGAIGAIAVTFVLVALGSAMGLMSVSPWERPGEAAAAVGIGAAIWIVVTQWLSSAFGGYLTGRLRTKWAATGTDEVFFRDTAHGFLAWALATVSIFVFAALFAAGGANVAATVGAGAAQGAARAAADDDSTAYFVDSLFRPASGADTSSAETPSDTASAPAAEAGAATNAAEPVAPAPAPAADVAVTTPPPAASPTAPTLEPSSMSNNGAREESARLLARSMVTDLPEGDRNYLIQLVAQQSGLSQAEAEARVDQVTADMKETAEAARKAAVALSFITALSLAIGAFVAAAAGGLGGQHRDLL